MLCILVNYHFKEKPTKAHGMHISLGERKNSHPKLYSVGLIVTFLHLGLDQQFALSTFKDQNIMLVTLLQRPLANGPLARSLYSVLQKLPFEPIWKIVFLCDITSARCVCRNGWLCSVKNRFSCDTKTRWY